MARPTPYDEYIQTLREKGISDPLTLLYYFPPQNPEMSLTDKLTELDTLKGWSIAFAPSRRKSSRS